MPVFEVTSPEGAKVKIEAENAKSALAKAMKSHGSAKQDFMSIFGGGLAKGLVGGLETMSNALSPNLMSIVNPSDTAAGQLERHLPSPQSLSGRAVQGLGEGLGNPLSYIGGAGSIPFKMLSGALSGAGSEVAGGLSNDNPITKILGGVGGGLIPRAAVRIRTPFTVPPERQAPLQELRSRGVEPSAGDVLGKASVRGLERLGDRFFGGESYKSTKLAAERQYTQAGSREMGEDAPFITAEVVNNARRRIGQVFERTAQELPIEYNRKLGDTLAKIEQEVIGTGKRSGYSDEVVKETSNLISRVLDGFVTRNRGLASMDGRDYQALTRFGEALQRAIDSSNPNISHFAGRIRTALDDAMTDTVDRAVKNAYARGRPGGPAQARAIQLATAKNELKEARRQWYNMLVISKSVSGSGEAAAEGLIMPERLRSNLTASADNKLQYAADRSSLHSLARAGAVILTPHRAASWEERAAGYGIPTALATALTGGNVGVGTMAGIATPGITGRIANLPTVQRYLKNQKAIALLNRMPGAREQAMRGAAIGASQDRKKRYGGTSD